MPNYVKREKRFRARITLPVEMLLACLQLGMAVIGGLTDSGIHRMLVANNLAEGWVVTVCCIGGAGLAVGLFEWAWGEGWANEVIRRACWVRVWVSLGSMVAWAYLAHMIFFYTEYNKAIFPLVFGPICILFHASCVLTVLRVGVLLDPHKDTHLLEARLDRRRAAN